MEPEKGVFPLAQPASSGAGGVSPPVSMLPEKLAEQSEAFGQAMIKLAATPVSEQKEAAEALISKLEEAAFSLNRFCREAGGPANAINTVITEAMRTNFEETVRFLDELAHAKGPAGALSLQFGYLTAQTQRLTEQSTVIMREVAKLFLAVANPHDPKGQLRFNW